MQQLSGMDATFVHLERNRNHFQIGALLTYDVTTAKDSFVRFKDILNTFDNRIGEDSVFRKRLHRVPFDLDYPYWVKDADFDVEHHVHHIALPKPGDWRQLCILVARLHARPMDMGRPLWEAYVIEGLDNVEGIPKGGFAVYIKLHHAAADGTATNELLGSIHDSVARPKKPPSKPSVGNVKFEAAPSSMQMLSRAYINTLKQPKRFLEIGRVVIPALRSKDTTKKSGKGDKAKQETMSTRFNGHVSGNTVLGVVNFEFESIRAIKNIVSGVTVNDVVLAIVSSSMQRYLALKKEAPKGDLSVGMPLNIRNMVEGLESSEQSGNLVSFSVVSLHNTEPDPVERLKSIHQSAMESKAYQNAVGAKLMLEVSRAMPAYFLSLAGRAMPMLTTGDAAPVSTAVTNVPGSPVPLYMSGARLAGMCGIGLVLEGIGLFHTVTSYCGQLTISFQACREMMPDPELYHECINEAFNELFDAAKAQQ